MQVSKENKISGLIITFNEEKNIEEIIQNLDFVDELIVVDSFSTDRTMEILLKYPHVKVIQNKFENYTKQRNFTLTFASNPWILFLDADERITSELKEEILQTVRNPKAKDAYYVYRRFMFNNGVLRFSGWQTDKNFRLFQKEKAHYKEDLLVHETLIVEGTIGILKNKIIHYSYISYDDYKKKMISYGKLKAKELYNKGKKPNFYHYYIKPAYKFLYAYLIRLGILDGKKGIIICYLNAYSVYVRYQELKRLVAENE